jgi:hypothetical protein
MTTPEPNGGPTPPSGSTPSSDVDEATSTWPAAAWTSPTPSGAQPPWPSEPAAPGSDVPPSDAPVVPAAGSASPPPAAAPAPAWGAGAAGDAPPAGTSSIPPAGTSSMPPAGAFPPGGTPPAGAFPPGGTPPAGAFPPGGTPPASAWGSVPPGGYQPAGPSQPGGTPPPSWAWSGQPPVGPASTTAPGLVAGMILVIVGAALLLSRVVDLSINGITWPLWIVVPGVAMLVGSFFIPPRGGLGLAVPGAIVTTVGIILWVQEAYGLYSTWAYAWALVAPTAPGLAMLLYGIVHRDGELAGDGLRTTLVGVGLFLGFALFFEGVIGLSGEPVANLEQVLPYAVIGLGVLLVVLSLFGGGSDRAARREQRHREREARRAARQAR